jgi:small subunit ribosomal protein S9
MSTVNAAHGTRKSSVANAYITTGSGQMTVKRSFPASKVRKLKRKNPEVKLQKNVAINDYFASLKGIEPTSFINELLEKAQLKDKVDIIITCKGGGLKAQIQAARLALAKALVKSDEELRPLISDYLRTDDRKRERRKVGLKGARAGTQFSKR